MSTTTVAQALANLRATGAKVSPVFYDHNPRRAKSKGGPQWHYSVSLPGQNLRAMVGHADRITHCPRGIMAAELRFPRLVMPSHAMAYATDARALVKLLERITQCITETQEV